MKYDPLAFQVKHYIREGTKAILKRDVEYKIVRHVRAHYIGLSSLTTCARLMWAKYYRPEIVPKQTIADEERTNRIFDLGHVIEDMTVQILKEGGADLSDAQIAFSDFGDVVRGHADSVLDNTHIVEIKSMNAHSFETFQSIGIRKSHPTYYVQMQMYMHYSKLKSAVLVATNKNTAEIDCEAVYFDEETVKFYLDKLSAITTHKFNSMPIKFIGDRDGECKFCVLKSICHKS